MQEFLKSDVWKTSQQLITQRSSSMPAVMQADQDADAVICPTGSSDGGDLCEGSRYKRAFHRLPGQERER
eukprot:3244826-Pyramimonas_sp.AAC.1